MAADTGNPNCALAKLGIYLQPRKLTQHFTIPKEANELLLRLGPELQ